MKNSVSCSCVQSRLHSRVKKRRRYGSGTRGAENIVRRRWSQGFRGILRVNASERELLDREMRRDVLRDSDVWNSLRGGIQRWGGDG